MCDSTLGRAAAANDVSSVLQALRRADGAEAACKIRTVALRHAVASDALEVVQLLLVQDLNVGLDGPRRDTLLHCACECGAASVARLLVARGAGVHQPNAEGEAPLHVASSVKVATILCDKGAAVDAESLDGTTPLHAALRRCRFDVAEFLVRHGANVNAACPRKGMRPLHLALAAEAPTALICQLLDHGAEVSAATRDGDTPLHLCMSQRTAALLVDHGAKVCAQNRGGESPLHHAARRGLTEVAALLLVRGAAVNAATTRLAETPLHWACEADCPAVVCLLMKHGAHLERVNGAGSSALHVAAAADALGAALVLLEENSSVGARPSQHGAWTRFWSGMSSLFDVKAGPRITPLHSASRANSHHVARLLLEHGVDPNVQAIDRSLPIECAAANGAWTTVRQLCRAGAYWAPYVTRYDTIAQLIVEDAAQVAMGAPM